MALHVTLRRVGTANVLKGTAQTDIPADAALWVAKAHRLGWRMVGNIQHFPGGTAYHIQFGNRIDHSIISLSSIYVAHIEPVREK